MEDLPGQATDAVRHAADSASEYGAGGRSRGTRYVRHEWDRYPEANRYVRKGREMISDPIEANPIAAVLIAGVILAIWLRIDKSSRWQWNRRRVSDYGRTRTYYRI